MRIFQESMKAGSKNYLFFPLGIVCIRSITPNQALVSPNPYISEPQVNFGSGNNQKKNDSRGFKWVLVYWLAVLVGAAFPVFTTNAADNSATVSYMPHTSGWVEGTLWWDCTSDFCAIHSFLPGGGGNWGPWMTGPLPIGHRYWLGTISMLSCWEGKWIDSGGGGTWYFNYDPRNSDQTAVVGEVCGSNIDLDRNLGPISCPVKY